MSDDKGKGRSVGDNDNVSSFDAQSSQSIGGRIIASAQGLAANAFAAPNANELSQSTSTALSNAGKSQQSIGSGSLAWAESSKVANQSSPSTGSSGQTAQPAAFRSQQDQHVAQAEAEFSQFLDGIDSFEPSALVERPYFDPEEYGKTEARRTAYGGHQERHGQSDLETYAEQDGKDVIDLLIRSRDDDVEQREVYNRPQEEDPVVWRMTDSQRKAWQKRFRLDFPESIRTTSNMPVDRQLNLIPHDHFQSEEERQQYLAEWQGVLDRYTDEVWGDLLPLVEEAREEIKTVGQDVSGLTNEKPKALRRLGLILQHLQQTR